MEGDKGREGYSPASLLVTIGGFALWLVGDRLEILRDVSHSVGALACNPETLLKVWWKA